jgi:hypothetical protein
MAQPSFLKYLSSHHSMDGTFQSSRQNSCIQKPKVPGEGKKLKSVAIPAVDLVPFTNDI